MHLYIRKAFFSDVLLREGTQGSICHHTVNKIMGIHTCTFNRNKQEPRLCFSAVRYDSLYFPVLHLFAAHIYAAAGFGYIF